MTRRGFVIKKIKILCHGHVTSDLKSEEIVGTFCKRELQKENRTEFRIKEVIKRKCDKLLVKWKGEDNSLNSWIDKKNIVT